MFWYCRPFLLWIIQALICTFILNFHWDNYFACRVRSEIKYNNDPLPTKPHVWFCYKLSALPSFIRRQLPVTMTINNPLCRQAVTSLMHVEIITTNYTFIARFLTARRHAVLFCLIKTTRWQYALQLSYYIYWEIQLKPSTGKWVVRTMLKMKLKLSLIPLQ